MCLGDDSNDRVVHASQSCVQIFLPTSVAEPNVYKANHVKATEARDEILQDIMHAAFDAVPKCLSKIVHVKGGQTEH